MREEDEDYEETMAHRTTQQEVDDMDKFIATVIETKEAQTEIQMLQQAVRDPVQPKPKGPHHGGPFITGDFMSESYRTQTVNHRQPAPKEPSEVVPLPMPVPLPPTGEDIQDAVPLDNPFSINANEMPDVEA